MAKDRKLKRAPLAVVAAMLCFNMTICDGADREVASYPIFGAEETEIAFDASAPGFYLLRVKVPANAVRLCAANVPVALEASEDPVNVISSACTLVFHKDRDERAVLAFCGDIPERVRAVVRDPDGNVVWDRDRIGEWAAFTAAAGAKGGFWTLEIKPPTAARFEDCSILVRGIIPELFLSDTRDS